MLKFCCQHCGQRIAVPARHLGKLVTCAECGGQTHPLAIEIARTHAPAAATPNVAPPPPPPPAATAATSCANCGIPIGRLQAAREWESERVCGACYHVLSAESSLRGSRAAPVVATRVPGAGHREDNHFAAPPAGASGLREQVVRGMTVFVVGVAALYGALTLLRDMAGLIAGTAVAVITLLAMYGLIRARWSARLKRADPAADAALVMVRGR